MKLCVIHSAYSDYTPENSPATATIGTALCLKVGNNSKKAHVMTVAIL